MSAIDYVRMIRENNPSNLDFTFKIVVKKSDDFIYIERLNNLNPLDNNLFHSLKSIEDKNLIHLNVDYVNEDYPNMVEIEYYIDILKDPKGTVLAFCVLYRLLFLGFSERLLEKLDYSHIFCNNKAIKLNEMKEFKEIFLNEVKKKCHESIYQEIVEFIDKSEMYEEVMKKCT